MQWAREHDCCQWDAWASCAFTAQGGHLAVLLWAREHGFAWDMTTCAEAARRGGHLELLLAVGGRARLPVG